MKRQALALVRQKAQDPANRAARELAARVDHDSIKGEEPFSVDP